MLACVSVQAKGKQVSMTVHDDRSLLALQGPAAMEVLQVGLRGSGWGWVGHQRSLGAGSTVREREEGRNGLQAGPEQEGTCGEGTG